MLQRTLFKLCAINCQIEQSFQMPKLLSDGCFAVATIKAMLQDVLSKKV
jgi:hypothetical protein